LKEGKGEQGVRARFSFAMRMADEKWVMKKPSLINNA
jgi:hypothetical protein